MTETKTITEEEIDLITPGLWKVRFLNDDVTPMELVIEILINVFDHSQENATALTLEIHNTGSAIAGVYPHEIAETLGVEATQIARNNGYPLRIQLEQE